MAALLRRLFRHGGCARGYGDVVLLDVILAHTDRVAQLKADDQRRVALLDRVESLANNFRDVGELLRLAEGRGVRVVVQLDRLFELPQDRFGVLGVYEYVVQQHIRIPFLESEPLYYII